MSFVNIHLSYMLPDLLDIMNAKLRSCPCQGDGAHIWARTLEPACLDTDPGLASRCLSSLLWVIDLLVPGSLGCHRNGCVGNMKSIWNILYVSYDKSLPELPCTYFIFEVTSQTIECLLRLRGKVCAITSTFEVDLASWKGNAMSFYRWEHCFALAFSFQKAVWFIRNTSLNVCLRDF